MAVLYSNGKREREVRSNLPMNELLDLQLWHFCTGYFREWWKNSNVRL